MLAPRKIVKGPRPLISLAPEREESFGDNHGRFKGEPCYVTNRLEINGLTNTERAMAEAFARGANRDLQTAYRRDKTH
jgi:hypothetical protein